MARRKLTPAKAAQCRELRATGRSIREIAELVGLSAGSVQTACRDLNTETPQLNTTPTTTPAVEGDAEGLPSLDDMRAWLADCARSARADETSTGRRTLLLATAALAKLTPREPPDPELQPDMMNAAAAALGNIGKLLERYDAAAAEQPPCSACGRPRPRELPPNAKEWSPAQIYAFHAIDRAIDCAPPASPTGDPS